MSLERKQQPFRPYTLLSLFKGAYFVTNVNGEPIGKDNDSGGYPFVAGHPNQVWFTWIKEEAERYIDVLNWKHKKGLGPKEYYLAQVTSINWEICC